MFTIPGIIKENTWTPDFSDLDRIQRRAKEILHKPQQEVCIVFEKDRYMEVVIYNEYVVSSFARFIIAPDYYWSWEEEIHFGKILKDECLAYDFEQFRDIYQRYSEEFPMWHLTFHTNHPLRLLDHIRQCMQHGSVKEILYKSGLDELAACMEGIEDYNMIGSSPSDIFSGLSIRLLRAINCPSGPLLLSTEKKRQKLLVLQNTYSWLFDESWNPSMCQYMNQMIEQGLDEKSIIQKFRKNYSKLRGFWVPSQYEVYTKELQIKEELSRELGEKIYKKIKEEDIANIHQLMIRNKEFWDAEITVSNMEREQMYIFADEQYSITYPQNIKEYVTEAIVQQNCLLVYLYDYVENYTDILFMRKVGMEEQPYITIEIFQENITQAFLKCNEKPEEEAIAWLKAYAADHGLGFHVNYDGYGYYGNE